MRRRNAMARRRRAVVERHVLMGVTSIAFSNERRMADGGDALESFVNDADHVITALNSGLISGIEIDEGR